MVFSGDGPSLVGNRAILPHPPRELSGPEATRIRGLADQMALRLAHHDETAHARLRPRSSEGSAIFEAIEQARTDAIGANALGGVRANLAASIPPGRSSRRCWALRPENFCAATGRAPSGHRRVEQETQVLSIVLEEWS